jgi:hypothetical protein
LVFERSNDRVCMGVGEHRTRLEPEIRNEAALRDPEVVSVTDARAAMPSKRWSSIHSEDAVGLCS